MATIGKRNTLTVLRDSSSGIYLDGGELGEILLPNRYVPRGVAMGDRLEVFVYRDSEDRLVATTETPRATVGEVATLKVISINRQVGAFLDWGLAKDLLLPFREQTGPVQVGQDVVVRVYLDEKTQRIVASMKLGRDAALAPPNFRAGRPPSPALDLSLNLLQQLRIPCRQHHRRAVLRKFQGNGPANPPARPRYDSDFVRQCLFHARGG
jgi:uncharacterized protein